MSKQMSSENLAKEIGMTCVPKEVLYRGCYNDFRVTAIILADRRATVEACKNALEKSSQSKWAHWDDIKAVLDAILEEAK